MYEANVTHFTPMDYALQLLVGRFIAPLVAYCQDETLVLGQFHQSPCFFRATGQWLIHKHMAARCQTIVNLFKVKDVWSANQNSIHILEAKKLLPIVKNSRLRFGQTTFNQRY